MVATAVASKGPIIHGSGVFKATHSSAAHRAKSRVRTTRTGKEERIDIGFIVSPRWLSLIAVGTGAQKLETIPA